MAMKNILSIAVAIIAVGCASSHPASYVKNSNKSGDDLVSRLLPHIAYAESSNNPKAIGGGKDIGLYQISPPLLKHYNRANKQRLSRNDLFSPDKNETVARWYLEWLNAQLTKHGYKDDAPRICCAYNWGYGNLVRNGFAVPDWFKNHSNETYRKIARGEIIP